MSLLAAFGVSRDSVQQLCFALVQPLDILDVIKQFVLRSMTVSFTRTPSIGDTICNFRNYCDSWDLKSPWPCTCSYLADTFGIFDSPDSYAPVPSHERHVHSWFDRCYGDHASILHSNLRDVLPPPVPASGSLPHGCVAHFLSRRAAFLLQYSPFSSTLVPFLGLGVCCVRLHPC